MSDQDKVRPTLIKSYFSLIFLFNKNKVRRRPIKSNKSRLFFFYLT